MSRTSMAGLLSLALVTLGVAITRGENSEDVKPAPEVEVTVSEASVDFTSANAVQEGAVDVVIESAAEPAIAELAVEPLVEIRLGDDDGITVGHDLIVQHHGEAGLTITGKGPEGAAGHGVFTARVQGGPIVDKGVRESIEKLIGSLKEDAERLQKDGKPQEADEKLRTAKALHLLLQGGPGMPGGPRHVRAMGLGHPAHGTIAFHHEVPEELQAKLKELHALHEKLSRSPDAANEEERAKIHKAIAEIHQKIGEANRDRAKVIYKARMDGPGAPGNRFFAFGGAPHPGFNPAEFHAIRQKADALRQAAEKLREAGIEDGARDLQRQAEKLQAEAAERERDLARQAKAQAFTHAIHHGPGPELRDAIRELQEQVQGLRKEVAQLRELLEKKQ